MLQTYNYFVQNLFRYFCCVLLLPCYILDFFVEIARKLCYRHTIILFLLFSAFLLWNLQQYYICRFFVVKVKKLCNKHTIILFQSFSAFLLWAFATMLHTCFFCCKSNGNMLQIYNNYLASIVLVFVVNKCYDSSTCNDASRFCCKYCLHVIRSNITNFIVQFHFCLLDCVTEINF
jgi:hypothetical protein